MDPQDLYRRRLHKLLTRAGFCKPHNLLLRINAVIPFAILFQKSVFVLLMVQTIALCNQCVCL